MKRITKQFLKKHRACTPAVMWGVEHDLISKPADEVLKALIKARKFDWANWLIVRVMKYKQYVSYAVFAAEQVISIYEKKYPNDNRPRNAIKAAKRCIENPSRNNKKAAYAAYADAAYAYAAYADAVYAAAYAAYAAYAAKAADASASAANAAYAAKAARKKMRLKILKYGLTLIT